MCRVSLIVTHEVSTTNFAEHALRAEVCAVELAIAYVPRSKGTKVVPSFLNCHARSEYQNFAEHALRAEVCAVELAIAYVPRNYKRSTSFVEDMRNWKKTNQIRKI